MGPLYYLKRKKGDRRERTYVGSEKEREEKYSIRIVIVKRDSESFVDI